MVELLQSFLTEILGSAEGLTLPFLLLAPRLVRNSA